MEPCVCVCTARARYVHHVVRRLAARAPNTKPATRPANPAATPGCVTGVQKRRTPRPQATRHRLAGEPRTALPLSAPLLLTDGARRGGQIRSLRRVVVPAALSVFFHAIRNSSTSNEAPAPKAIDLLGYVACARVGPRASQQSKQPPRRLFSLAGLPSSPAWCGAANLHTRD